MHAHQTTLNPCHTWPCSTVGTRLNGELTWLESFIYACDFVPEDNERSAEPARVAAKEPVMPNWLQQETLLPPFPKELPIHTCDGTKFVTV